MFFKRISQMAPSEKVLFHDKLGLSSKNIRYKAMFLMWKRMEKTHRYMNLAVKFVQIWCWCVLPVRAMTMHAMVTGTVQSVTNVDMALRADEWANV